MIQLRRAATAIPTRISEGCGRETNPEFAVELRRGIAASNELDYLLLLSKDLGFMKPEIYDSLNSETVEVRKMIYGLLRKL